MIKTFSHKGLEWLFLTGNKKGIDTKHAPRIIRLLDRLDSAKEPGDMNLPGFGFGFGFHPLTGNRKGTYSVKVTGNWRITFIKYRSFV